MAAVQAPAAARTVGDVVEDIGMGPYQVKEAVISGGVGLADGAELLLIGSVSRAVALEWNLSATQKGAVVSIVFLGVFIGNLASGPCADRVGRRWPVLISYPAIAIFSILSAFTVGFWSLSFARFFVGMAFGFGWAATIVYRLEISPAAWRTLMIIFGGFLWVLGEAYGAWIVWLDDPTLNQVDWRWLLIVGAFPAVLLTFVAAAFLNESPSWLASHGNQAAARHVLSKMNRTNGSRCVCLDFSPPPQHEDKREGGLSDLRRHACVIFGDTMLFSTLVSCFTLFSMNFVYYGGLYAFPQVFSMNVSMGMSPAVALLRGAVWTFPGYFMALAFDRVMDRRPTLMVSMCALTICMISFVQGGTNSQASWPHYYMLHVGYAGYKCFTTMLSSIGYQYSAELYPVTCRATGVAFASCMGRIGAMTAPLAFEWIVTLIGTWTVFFYMMAAFLTLNMILVAFLPFETRGKTLQESAIERHETEPLCKCLERGKTT